MLFTRKFAYLNRILIIFTIVIVMLSTNAVGIFAMGEGAGTNISASALGNNAIVFVSRKIPNMGSVYMNPNETGSLPGVGPYSRFQVAAPGKLIVREANGVLRTLIDGSNPNAASLNLIDVNAPDVSYDATKIVFAGLKSGSYDTGPMTNPGAWRIYIINVDGTGLRQATFSDRDNLDLSQFGSNADDFAKYDDTDPAWLPDGRIVFSSTRWPEYGQYGGAHATNLYVVNENGSGLHRITSERNAADRPQIDPLTGKIVYSRWWRNFRVGTNDMRTIPNPGGGYIMKDGLLVTVKTDVYPEVGIFKNLERNAWHLATINPDGTSLAQWAGASNTTFGGQIINHAYGGSFAPDGSFYANFFPMFNQTEAAGFGGIRHYQRGPNGYTGIIGITHHDESVLKFVKTNPNSYGIYQGNYAAEPEVLPDGSLIISWAPDVKQDYGLYIINADGSGRTLLYNNPDTTELRTRLIKPRIVPPIIPDKITQVASQLPPLASGPYDTNGTFTFDALNVYFNAPVDVNIISAIPVGSANTIRFFIDHQRAQQTGSVEAHDWPILLQEKPVNPDGSVMVESPANVPLFEQIRSKLPGYTVPLTGRTSPPEQGTGAAHVAGLNFGRPGEVVQCVGCHAGHTMIPVPDNPEDAKWTNLAPGAALSVSSLNSSLKNNDGLIDRRVKMKLPQDNFQKYWLSKSGQNPNSQWVQLNFPVPISVRNIRLYNIPGIDSSIKVLNTTVRLYSDKAGTIQVASNISGPLSEDGTDVLFNDVLTRVVRIEFTSVNGSTAGLGEVEVIARAEADIPYVNINGNVGLPGATLTYGETTVNSRVDGSYAITVPQGWNGSVTPTHDCFTFNPSSRTYNNVLASQTNQDYTATAIPSTVCVMSITRANPNPTSASSVDFKVIFSAAVTGVDISDFALTTTGVTGSSIMSVSGSGETYTVIVDPGSGNGTIRLHVADNDSIKDASSNPLGGSGGGNGDFTTSEMYLILKEATFADVPTDHSYYEYIEVLYANGLTNGCSITPKLYCPSMSMNRAQIAKFFMTVELGGTYEPPVDTPKIFVDNWSKNPWAEVWANDMKVKDLTSGCNLSPTLYCPDVDIPREQVAKLALAIKYGSSYIPPAAMGTVFADLTDVNHWSTAWAEQAYLEGLVPACGTDVGTGKPLFCPNDKVDRGFASFVIVTATGLLGP